MDCLPDLTEMPLNSFFMQDRKAVPVEVQRLQGIAFSPTEEINDIFVGFLVLIFYSHLVEGEYFFTFLIIRIV